LHCLDCGPKPSHAHSNTQGVPPMFHSPQVILRLRSLLGEELQDKATSRIKHSAELSGNEVDSEVSSIDEMAKPAFNSHWQPCGHVCVYNVCYTSFRQRSSCMHSEAYPECVVCTKKEIWTMINLTGVIQACLQSEFVLLDCAIHACYCAFPCPTSYSCRICM